MESMTVYRIDADDPPELTPDIAERFETLFLDEISPEERPEDKRLKPHDGIKALRAIKTNGFTAPQVAAFQRYVSTLIARREHRIATLIAEQAEVPRDSMSIRAYDHLIQSMQAGVAEARGMIDAFVAAFQDRQGVV